jgi:transposase
VRAAVVAALLAGQSVSQVAKEYKLPKGTVSNWKHRKADGLLRGTSESGTQKRNDVSDLLLDLVQANLRGLIAGAGLLQDETWLRTQNAADLAVLFGVTFDKTARLLEALGGRDHP